MIPKITKQKGDEQSVLIISLNLTYLQGYSFHKQFTILVHLIVSSACKYEHPCIEALREICVKNVSLPTQIYNNTVPLPHFFLKLNVRSLQWSTNLALNLPKLNEDFVCNDKLIRLLCFRASLDFLCREVPSFPFMHTHAHRNRGIYVVHIYLFFIWLLSRI